MPVASATVPAPSSSAKAVGTSFTEEAAWQNVRGGWHPLHGNYQQLGYSVEWHDFLPKDSVDWGRSFHPGSIEICLNLAGRGSVTAGTNRMEFAELSAGFYRQNAGQFLDGERKGGERHQFLTVELAPSFVRKQLLGSESHLHPLVRDVVAGRASAGALAETTRLTAEHQQLLVSLRHPPVLASAQPIWYHAKTLEVMAAFLFSAPPDRELFCQRQKRVAQDRVDRVITILKAHMTEPPTLEALGRQVGCSPFYLSRIFSQQMGTTISQYLRQLRMERAAVLLKEGQLNVTQVAMEVGYSSCSHFSAAFHETFGCCPGLYPLATATQRSRLR